jgi:hypothetical protein
VKYVDNAITGTALAAEETRVRPYALISYAGIGIDTLTMPTKSRAGFFAGGSRESHEVSSSLTFLTPSPSRGRGTVVPCLSKEGGSFYLR